MKLDPCKCLAVIMQRNYALPWSKHNHSKISLLSGEAHVCLKCQLLRARKNILALSWMTVQFWQSGKGFFEGFMHLRTWNFVPIYGGEWNHQNSQKSYDLYAKYFACIAGDQSETSALSVIMMCLRSSCTMLVCVSGRSLSGILAPHISLFCVSMAPVCLFLYLSSFSCPLSVSIKTLTTCGG